MNQPRLLGFAVAMFVTAMVAAIVVPIISAVAAIDPAVKFFAGDEVAAAFRKGATLYNSGGNFRIEASRRDHSGDVEVHTLDTDVTYVLGRQPSSRGGKMIGGSEVAPNEIRGTSIVGGAIRHLAKGDVIVVPAGTPHWFKEVPAPFLYYVVKVR